MLVDAKMLVAKEIAESFPARQDRVQECVTQAQEAMSKVASERSRHLTEPPRLVEMRDTALGFVELLFQADTESD